MIQFRTWPLFQWFGDGSDGAVTAVTSSLQDYHFYTTLTVPNGVTLDTNKFPVWATQRIWVQNGGILQCTANNGGNASGATGGTAGTADNATAKPLGRSYPGVTGRTATNSAGGSGNQFTTAHWTETNGGGTGAGGAGGNGVAAGGGASTAPVTETNHVWRRITPWILTGRDKPGSNTMSGHGGSAGSSGGGDLGAKKGGGGGGSGAGGGCMSLWAPIIQIDAGGQLLCQGGNGGNGGDGEAGGGATGGGGGGGGAGGGRIFMYLHQLINNGTLSVAGGTGGSPGAGGGGGASGSAGQNGRNGRIIVYNLLTGTWTVT